MTADQTLEHPWLRRKIPPPPPELITTKENLRTFVDNYHNINGIENNVEQIINTKPSALSAVELIAASDKEFMNRSSVKSFSNDSNENPLPPVRFPIVVTNNNLPPVMNDNNLTVDNSSSTNDDVLNIMNANIPSMPSPDVLDNASAAPLGEPIVPVSESNFNQVVRFDEKDNNNAPVTNPAIETEPKPVVEIDDLPINVPLADMPPRVLEAPEIPVAPLPFISKSLPAAAALLDESLVEQLKPLRIPLTLPELPELDIVDEPIIVHPPVFSTTLPPPKRGSIDVDSVFSQQKLDEIDRAKPGSIEVLSLLTKRGSIDIGAKMTKRDSISKEDTVPEIVPIEIQPQSSLLELPMQDTSLSLVEPTTIKPKPEPDLPLSNNTLGNVSPKDEIVTKGIASPTSEIPHVQAHAPAIEPALASSTSLIDSQGIFPIVPSSPGEPVAPVPEFPVLSQPPVEDLFIPQPPAVVKISTSPVTISGPSAQSPPSSLLSHDVDTSEPIASTSFLPIRAYSPPLPAPLPFTVPETSRSPASPITTNVISPPRRESPLQKTLDEIPKISSEILSSLRNLPSLSRPSSFDVSSSKTSFTSKRASSTESTSSYSSLERVSSPRVVSFTEHTTSSFVPSVIPKVYPKIQGITLGRAQSEEKSAFANVSSKVQTSGLKRYDSKESETSRQSTQRVETSRQTSRVETSRQSTQRVETTSRQSTQRVETKSRFEPSRIEPKSEKTIKAEADALAAKQKLRSTAPWFSERKAAEANANIEKKSSDINALLKESLGPLERSPWAREIRQISAKLVEMSHTTALKQQEDERLMEMNNQQAKRQKFKVSVLNRDVVFGAAREFYIGGEVSGTSKDQLLGKQVPQAATSKTTINTTRSSRLSPERRTRSTTYKSSSSK